MPVGHAEMTSLAGGVYVLQPVMHVDAVLPRELRSGLRGLRTAALVETCSVHEAAVRRPEWHSARVCGRGYVVTILGNFKHVGSLPAARPWLLHHPVPVVQCVGMRARHSSQLIGLYGLHAPVRASRSAYWLRHV